ncbi:UDP-N-acetylmuramate dehydrogenase [Leifsonia kafniensis]|uniref:UDP-N-acetylenolpyruvoylglucosamine reductase n=1 Tax=Leifsonia kafniensis TaxID=475957 RepID=A0ABP7KLK1_9MICO
MISEFQTPPIALRDLTTLRVGGVPAAMVTPKTEQELVAAALEVWAEGDEWMLLGGGSNTVAADEGFDGTVIRILTRGIEVIPVSEYSGSVLGGTADIAHGEAAGAVGAEASGGLGGALGGDGAGDGARVRLRVQAGESWDELVAFTAAQGWAGIEALSGIPGSVGAAPVQNIGAYGQEIASCLVAVDFLDFDSGDVRRIGAADLKLDYRTSAFKQGLIGIVLAVELELHDTHAEAAVLGSALGRPVAYAQLAGALGVQQGDRVALDVVRSTVLALRASKGMVLDANDPDTASAGSFFTNPIVTENFARQLPDDAPRWSQQSVLADRVIPLEEYAGVGPVPCVEEVRLTKLSAAWLIEQAGIAKGFRLPGSRAAISSKHTLALTNTGGATADEIAQLARFVQGRVAAEFGVILQPEPVLIGVSL